MYSFPIIQLPLNLRFNQLPWCFWKDWEPNTPEERFEALFEMNDISIGSKADIED